MSLLGFVSGGAIWTLLLALAGYLTGNQTLLENWIASAIVPAVALAILVGRTVRQARLDKRPQLQAWSRAFGTLLGILVVLVMSWALNSLVTVRDGQSTMFQADLRSSPIVQALNEILPIRPNAISSGGPPARISSPEAKIVDDPDVIRAQDSVVLVLGKACGEAHGGSGWVAARGLVVTNAHVIAGQRETFLAKRRRGRFNRTIVYTTHKAIPVYFDLEHDVAVLRVDTDLPALRMVPHPRPGTAAALLGFPEYGPNLAIPARLGEIAVENGEDFFGNPIERPVFTVRAHGRGGNSGGPIVDADGRVLATDFLRSANPNGEESRGVPNEFVERALREASTEVDTGACLND